MLKDSQDVFVCEEDYDFCTKYFGLNTDGIFWPVCVSKEHKLRSSVFMDFAT